MVKLFQRALGSTILSAYILTSPLSAQATPLPAGWKYTGKAHTAEAAHGMVASGNPIASEVGRDIMMAGGNAIDAAVAVGFALAVTHPEAGNIGGGGFLVMRTGKGSTEALDFRETAPAGATRDMYLDVSGNPTDKSLYGALAAGVPGSVAGLAEAHRKYGKLSWSEVVAPAVKLAKNGYRVDNYRSRSIGGAAARLIRYSGTATELLVNGQAPAAGTILQQPQLAATLEAIQTQGRDGFYRGRVADLIVAEMERGNGIISHADLESYQPKWRTPVEVSYRGWKIWSMPPSSSGGITLAMIFNMQQVLGPLPAFGSAALLHREAEVMRRAFTARNSLIGDTDFESVPLVRLLSPEWAAAQIADFDPQHATPTSRFDPKIREGNHTTSYSVVDGEGNAVAVTTTLNSSYGSHVTVSGAGFLLNNEMDDFASAPGKPNQYGLVQGEINAIKPGKRMLSAMSPSVVADPSGRTRLIVGTPGGPTIITQVYHVISNVIDHQMSLPMAVEAPRMHHQALPDEIRIESPFGFDSLVVMSLQQMGHKITTTSSMGDVQAIARTLQGWLGVSDPRLGGGPSGY